MRVDRFEHNDKKYDLDVAACVHRVGVTQSEMATRISVSFQLRASGAVSKYKRKETDKGGDLGRPAGALHPIAMQFRYS